MKIIFTPLHGGFCEGRSREWLRGEGVAKADGEDFGGSKKWEELPVWGSEAICAAVARSLQRDKTENQPNTPHSLNHY